MQIKLITIITKGNSNHAPRCLREAWLLFLSNITLAKFPLCHNATIVVIYPFFPPKVVYVLQNSLLYVLDAASIDSRKYR